MAIPRALRSPSCIALLLLCAWFCQLTHGFDNNAFFVVSSSCTIDNNVRGSACRVLSHLGRDASIHGPAKSSLLMSSSASSPEPGRVVEDPGGGCDVESSTSSSSPRVDEARQLLDQASALRRQADAASEALRTKRQQSVGANDESVASRPPKYETDSSKTGAGGTASTTTSPFALPLAVPTTTTQYEYRLHVDIGREPGSWMEPRWGASGRRIEFTIDVRFTSVAVEDGTGEGVANQQPHASSYLLSEGNGKGWFRSQRQSCFLLDTAPCARMRSGFDRMRCLGGVYRIERDASGKKRDGTVRFCIQVEGTTDYGDVTIPPGYVYFSIPAFSSNLSLLSRKPGPVTIRQQGWNTGWRREESRIVGVFLATPLERS